MKPPFFSPGRLATRTPLLALAALLLARYTSIAIAADQSAADEPAELEFFEKQVRPILVEHCQECHGEKKREGGLNLMSRAAVFHGGDSGPALEPGRADRSLLVKAIEYRDEPKMPPSGKLAPAQIETLKRWIERGAAWPKSMTPNPASDGGERRGFQVTEKQRSWWAFQPVKKVEPPQVGDDPWPRNDIDRFVLHELKRHALSPTSEASREMWLRRATFDVTGLPPTLEEREAFLADTSAQAFERVVDRLLASPQYGERWARHWLDVARYADYYDANPAARTASCELTEAWRYRDWVVDALNRDLPYDQFIVHQIAGDLLPPPAGAEIYPEGLIATTFLSNGVWDRGDADKEKIISDMADDNIDVVGKAFLGLTLGCARCHDHKFDPISTEDYYGLAGIFYSSHILKDLGAKGAEYVMNRVPLVGPTELAKRATLEKELAGVQSRIASLESQQRYRELIQGGSTLKPISFRSSTGAEATLGDDSRIVVRGNLGQGRYFIETQLPEGVDSPRYLRLETIPDPSLPSQGAGRAGDGNFVVSKISVKFADSGDVNSPLMPAKLVGGRADFEQTGLTAASALDDNLKDGWAVVPHVAQPHVAAFEIAAETKFPPRARIVVELEHFHSDVHSLGSFRLSVAKELAAGAPVKTAELLDLQKQRANVEQKLANPVPLAMATTEQGTAGGLFPGIQDVPIHVRGSYARPGPVVPRRMPRFFAGDDAPRVTQGSGRDQLARWVASPTHPLTARVMVNRVWQWHFGEGLVKTPSNFGLLSEPPSHPLLLDWLASRFVDDGWSLKKLHRLILLSATYRQSSQASSAAWERDPENRWWGRFSSRRLEAESIRDAMLAVAGRLDLTPKGPAGDDFTIRRRSLYVQTARWQRDSYANLFDAANPDASTDKRITSTVAPQALLLLNHPFVQEQARSLAERLAAETPVKGDGDKDMTPRMERAYRMLFGRSPTVEEVAVARQVLGDPDPARPLAPWIDLAHLLLCSNEFFYVD